MSHSTIVRHGNESFVAIHNGDWSGPVILRHLIDDPSAKFGERVVSEMTLDGALVVRLALAIVEPAARRVVTGIVARLFSADHTKPTWMGLGEGLLTFLEGDNEDYDA